MNIITKSFRELNFSKLALVLTYIFCISWIIIMPILVCIFVFSGELLWNSLNLLSSNNPKWILPIILLSLIIIITVGLITWRFKAQKVPDLIKNIERVAYLSLMPIMLIPMIVCYIFIILLAISMFTFYNGISIVVIPYIIMTILIPLIVACLINKIPVKQLPVIVYSIMGVYILVILSTSIIITLMSTLILGVVLLLVSALFFGLLFIFMILIHKYINNRNAKLFNRIRTINTILLFLNILSGIFLILSIAIAKIIVSIWAILLIVMFPVIFAVPLVILPSFCYFLLCTFIYSKKIKPVAIEEGHLVMSNKEETIKEEENDE